MFDRSREKTESVLEKTLFATDAPTSPAKSGVAEAPAQGKT